MNLAIRLAKRILLAACALGLVLLGMALAPVIVAGRGPPEAPAAPSTPSQPDTYPAAELELRQVISQRRDTAIAADLERLAGVVASLEAMLPRQEGKLRAAAENELGLARRQLGEARKDAALIAESIGHYRRALSGFEAEADAKAAAAVRWNLALALLLEARVGRDNTPLREAADLLRELVDSDDPALDRKAANRHLGLALLTLGEADNSTRMLAEAVTALEAALVGAGNDGRDRLEWAETQNALATALQALAEREWSLERLEAALKARRNAWVLYQSAGLDTYRFYFDTRIAALEELIETRRAAPLAAADAAVP